MFTEVIIVIAILICLVIAYIYFVIVKPLSSAHVDSESNISNAVNAVQSSINTTISAFNALNVDWYYEINSMYQPPINANFAVPPVKNTSALTLYGYGAANESAVTTSYMSQSAVTGYISALTDTNVSQTQIDSAISGLKGWVALAQSIAIGNSFPIGNTTVPANAQTPLSTIWSTLANNNTSTALANMYSSYLAFSGSVGAVAANLQTLITLYPANI